MAPIVQTRFKMHGSTFAGTLFHYRHNLLAQFVSTVAGTLFHFHQDEIILLKVIQLFRRSKLPKIAIFRSF